MGNCLRHQSAAHWGGDEWGSPVVDGGRLFTSNNTRHHHDMQEKAMMNMEKKGLHAEDINYNGGFTSKNIISSSATTSSSSSTEVKIKITKKLLEELLVRADIKELSVQQVLAQLINFGGSSSNNDQHETHPRSWRPNLQSIPE